MSPEQGELSRWSGREGGALLPVSPLGPSPHSRQIDCASPSSRRPTTRTYVRVGSRTLMSPPQYGHSGGFENRNAPPQGQLRMADSTRSRPDSSRVQG